MKRHIPWDLIIAHLKDEITPEEKELFLQWVAIPENYQLYQSLAQLWKDIRKDAAGYQPDINFFRQEIMQKMQHSEQITSTPSKQPGNRFWILSRIAVAASVLLFFWGGYTLWINHAKDDSIKDIAKILEQQQPDTKEVLLVMSGKEKIEVTPDATIVYSDKGEVKVNSEKIEKGVTEKNDKQKPEYDQLVVPKGKRTTLNLSDGSKLWINSGSRVVYPRVFAPDRREIYVDGEAYLEVKRNEQAPFIVKTDRFEVKVLGTVFNISAYKKMETSSVVLVEGSVNVKDENNIENRLLPNEAVEIKNGAAGNKEVVETKYYTAWVDGFLLLKSEPIVRLLDKLNYYYGKKIIYTDDIKDLQLNGKLDLKENILETLEMIASSTAITYKVEGDDIYIKKRVQ